jgi:heme-degrading monooxygenase HmoA
MIVTVFRSRLKESGKADYFDLAPQMGALAKTMPGYISHKSFVADDSERVTIVEFADEASQRNWATNAQHVQAKKAGIQDFYAEYKLQVCNVTKESKFPG